MVERKRTKGRRVMQIMSGRCSRTFEIQVDLNFKRPGLNFKFSPHISFVFFYLPPRSPQFEFFQEDWEDISEPAKDLISKLLVVDPSRRITAQAALQHEWICKVDDDDLSARSLSSSLDSLRSSLKSIQTEEGYTAEWLIEGREMIQ